MELLQFCIKVSQGNIRTTECIWRKDEHVIARLHCIWFSKSKVNSLAPGSSECDSKNIIFNLVLLIGIFRSPHDNALWWMPQDLTDGKSTLVQVTAWCRQATSYCLSQCWPRSMSPYDVTWPLSQIIWTYLQSDSQEHIYVNFLTYFKYF